MGLLKAPGDDDRLLFQIVLLHRLEVAVAPLGVRRAVPPSTCTIHRCPRLLSTSSSSSSVWGFSSCHDKTPESYESRGGGGGWGIRTPEGLHPTRFPSVRHRPLGESSRRSTRRQPRATRKEYIGPPIPGASPGRWDLSRGAGLPASAQRGRTAGLGDAPAGTVLEPYGASSTSSGGGGGGSQPGAGSGSLSLGPSCGVIQRIPQDRKVARVSRLWRVREGSSRARVEERTACRTRWPEGIRPRHRRPPPDRPWRGLRPSRRRCG